VFIGGAISREVAAAVCFGMTKSFFRIMICSFYIWTLMLLERLTITVQLHHRLAMALYLVSTNVRLLRIPQMRYAQCC
jgi:hypothetical protein